MDQVKQVEELAREASVDILSMLFSRDEEGQEFHEILNEQVKYDFGYKSSIDIP